MRRRVVHLAVNEDDESWFRRASRQAGFRCGVLAIGVGVFLSGYLVAWEIITWPATLGGLMAPLKKLTAAEKEQHIAAVELGLLVMLIGLVAADTAWKRWAFRRSIAAPVAVVVAASLVSCCAFAFLFTPILVWLR